MITIGDAVLWLRANLDKLPGDLKKAEGVVDKSLSSMGAKMNDWGNKLTLGVTAPIVALGAASVNAASDYNESLSKVETVFDTASTSVKEFSDISAASLGISKRAALEATGTYGNLLRAVGLGSEASAEMSIGLTTLAADLASFNNIDPTVALEKLRAGLTGEAEPLKTLGINMNQARLQAKALEMGLVTQGQALDSAAKAQAAYAIMMEDTTLAQGDAVRTGDQLAGMTRRVKAQLDDALVDLGQNLLPIVLKIVTGLNSLLTAFNALPGPVKTAIVALMGVAAAAGPVMKGISGISTALGVLGKIGGVAAGAAGAGGAGAGAGVFGGMAAAGTALLGILKAIGAALLGIATSPIVLLIAAIGLLAFTIKVFGRDALETLKAVGRFVRDLFTVGVQTGKANLDEIGRYLRQQAVDWLGLLGKFSEGINETFSSLHEYFTIIIEDGDWLNDWLTHLPRSLQPVAAEVGRMLSNVISGARKMTGYFSVVGKEIIYGIYKGLRDGWTWLLEKVQRLARDMLNAAKKALDVKSPSGVFAREVGQPSAQGIATGFTGYIDQLSKQISGSLDRLPVTVVRQSALKVEKIEYHGALSQDERDWMERRHLRSASNLIVEALGNPIV